MVISNQEILSIGGFGVNKQVWKYNVQASRWTQMPDLIEGRYGSGCQFYKNGPSEQDHYVLVAGGNNTNEIHIGAFDFHPCTIYLHIFSQSTIFRENRGQFRLSSCKVNRVVLSIQSK